MSPALSRDEHLAWAKERALRYLDAGNLADAFASMVSDLDKHADFRQITAAIGPVGMLYVMNRDARNLRRWIEGFN